MELLDLKSPKTVEFIDRIERARALIKEAFAQRTPRLNKEKFLTNDDMEKILNMSKRVLQNYRDSGMLPYIKISGKILYKESDVLRVLEDNYYPTFNKQDR